MPRILVRHIGWALLAKTVALAAVYFAFFGPAHRHEVSPELVRDVIFSESESAR